MKMIKTPALPEGITQADLKTNYSEKNWAKRMLTKAQVAKLEAMGLEYTTRFELWYSDDQWHIPTLVISARKRAGTERTYAVGVSDGKIYRIGHGPHVTAKVTVYVTRGNFKQMLKYLQLKLTGEASANKVRDRISSRRAQGQVYRAEGRRSWRW